MFNTDASSSSSPAEIRVLHRISRDRRRDCGSCKKCGGPFVKPPRRLRLNSHFHRCPRSHSGDDVRVRGKKLAVFIPKMPRGQDLVPSNSISQDPSAGRGPRGVWFGLAHRRRCQHQLQMKADLRRNLFLNHQEYKKTRSPCAKPNRKFLQHRAS